MNDALTTEQPSGADRAAVMVMLLGEEDASRLLSQLSPDELRTLGSKMCSLGDVGPAAIADAIASFAQSAERSGISSYGRVQNVQRLMTGAVGEIKASNLMRSVVTDENAPKTPALDLARWLEPEVLIPLVSDEPPQAIAVLLVQLDPAVAAKVLAGLPEDLHTPVVHRVAKLNEVSAQAIAILERTLAAKISRIHGMAMHRMGGIREAADLLNNSGRVLEKRVMPAIGKLDRQLAKQLESEMFKFEHLYKLDPMQMGQLLREVESDALIDALKGIPDEERDVFFAAMSGRAADGVRDEIDVRGRLKRADVERAQKEIIAVAKRLAADGTIVLGDGDDEYV